LFGLIDDNPTNNNIPIISTEKDSENRTFADCYSEIAGSILLASIFTPYTIDLTDPEMKNYFSNVCNFYYEKSGKWIKMLQDSEIAAMYGQEFYNKYGNTIPESLSKLLEYDVGVNQEENYEQVNQEDEVKLNSTFLLGEERQILSVLLKPVTQNTSALGDERAKITIVEFGDYQCQYCARFNKETKNSLVTNFVETGKVKFIFKDFIVNDLPSDKASTLAAEASYCAAEQGKYWDYHDELYRNSKGENTGWITKHNLEQFANNTRINDLMKFSSCIDSHKYNYLVSENDNLARTIGLTSTPSFILYNGSTPVTIKETYLYSGTEGPYLYSVLDRVINEMD
jgi:protein-disulfide isomerase